jgi:hypothetical protein
MHIEKKCTHWLFFIRLCSIFIFYFMSCAVITFFRFNIIFNYTLIVSQVFSISAFILFLCLLFQVFQFFLWKNFVLLADFFSNFIRFPIRVLLSYPVVILLSKYIVLGKIFEFILIALLFRILVLCIQILLNV